MADWENLNQQAKDQGYFERLAAKQPGYTYGDVLPFKKSPSGDVSFDPAAGLIGGVLSPLAGFERILRGKVPSHTVNAEGKPEINPEIRSTAGETALNMAGGGMSVGRAPAGSAGMFIGTFGAKNLAKTGNKVPLENRTKYFDMIQAGHDPEIVRQKTGWFTDPLDGQLKYEISDHAASIREGVPTIGSRGDVSALPEVISRDVPNEKYFDVKAERDATHNVGKYLDHPELFNAYPALKYSSMNSTGFDFGLKGAFDPVNKNVYMAPAQKQDFLSTLLHELQHGIQEKEFFGRGGNTSQTKTPMLEKTRAHYEPAYIEAFQQVLPDVDVKYRKPASVVLELQAKARGRRQAGIPELSEAEQNLYILAQKMAQIDRLDGASFAKYRDFPGERESRNVQLRQKLSPEFRKEISPTESLPERETPAFLEQLKKDKAKQVEMHRFFMLGKK